MISVVCTELNTNLIQRLDQIFYALFTFFFVGFYKTFVSHAVPQKSLKLNFYFPSVKSQFLVVLLTVDFFTFCLFWLFCVFNSIRFPKKQTVWHNINHHFIHSWRKNILTNSFCSWSAFEGVDVNKKQVELTLESKKFIFPTFPLFIDFRLNH